MKKNWKQKNGLNNLKEVIEANTGIKENDLLFPKKDPCIYQLKQAVLFIKTAIMNGLPIHVIADYDCDGVMSGTILDIALREAGANVTVRFPRRFSEGYGLSMKIIDEITDGVILTIDNGIAAVEQVQAAKIKGLKTVIIDHHLRREDGQLPPAEIIVDPNAINRSEFNDYCAAGLAYRFAKELIPGSPLLKKLVAFAGIATVADVMPLIGDNRNLVKEAIDSIHAKEVTAGFEYLLAELNVTRVTESDFGFKLGPIVNASGRLEDDGPRDVYELLRIVSVDSQHFAEETLRLSEMTKVLIDRNIKRQELVRVSMLSAYEQIEKQNLADKKPIILYDAKWSEGIVGIIAGHIAEEYKTPAIAFTNSSTPGILKGSARSFGGVHLKHSLDKVSDSIIGYGGHAGAAGLSIHCDKIDELRNRLSDVLKDYDFSKDKDNIYFDLEIDVSEIPDYIQALNKYAPFGEGNPQVVFKVNNFVVSPRGSDFFRLMGKQQQHIKFFSPTSLTAVGFDLTEKYVEEGKPKTMDFVGYLSQNWFGGTPSDQVEIIDFNGKNDEKKKTEAFKSLESLLVFK